MDCPGIVFARAKTAEEAADVMLRNCVKVCTPLHFYSCICPYLTRAGGYVKPWLYQQRGGRFIHIWLEPAYTVCSDRTQVEKIDDLMVPIGGILRRCEAAQLQGQYGIGDFQDATQFLTLVAMKRGQLRKGGAADQEAAARVVMQARPAYTRKNACFVPLQALSHVPHAFFDTNAHAAERTGAKP
eukprot:5097851-Pleurochrysis_carterae.AAC.1